MRGQLLDAAVVLVLIFATLFATTYLSTEEPGFRRRHRIRAAARRAGADTGSRAVPEDDR
ncbi:hypothetical protein HBB16_19480 [Pseudonocardia sp. MCCB 268]|nr:hypothetical protein [Pseudonocardia cytotoxica]